MFSIKKKLYYFETSITESVEKNINQKEIQIRMYYFNLVICLP
jgi:hypothetical protein